MISRRAHAAMETITIRIDDVTDAIPRAWVHFFSFFFFFGGVYSSIDTLSTRWRYERLKKSTILS